MKQLCQQLIIYLLSVILAILAFLAYSIPLRSHQIDAEPTPPSASSPILVIVETPEIPPILAAIAVCESGSRQFNADGSVLRGRINPKDVGKWQISETYWLEAAKKLGYDIYTIEGNTSMALYIYELYGTQPWKWSENCWVEGR